MLEEPTDGHGACGGCLDNPADPPDRGRKKERIEPDRHPEISPNGGACDARRDLLLFAFGQSVIRMGELLQEMGLKVHGYVHDAGSWQRRLDLGLEPLGASIPNMSCRAEAGL